MGSYLGGVATAPFWNLCETLSFSGDTTKTTATLPVYKYYMIELIDIIGNQGRNILIRCNGDSGANYTYQGISNGSAVLAASSQTSIIIGEISNTYRIAGQIFVQGYAQTALTINGGASGAIANALLSGKWNKGSNGQLTDLTFLLDGAGTISGTIRIWGKN